MYSAQELLILYSSVPTAVPFFIGLARRKKLDPTQKLIVGLSLVTFGVGAWSALLWLSRQNNLFLGHFYTPIQYFLILAVYRLQMRDYVPRRFFQVLLWGFLVFTLVNSLWIQPLASHNSNARALSAVVLVFLSLGYFFRLVYRPHMFQITRIPMFWFNSGVFLYFFTTLFIFVVSNFIQPDHNITLPAWTLHNVFMWLFFVLSSIAVGISPKTS
ncbi:MAG: hypothetical protein AAFQ98_02800 [Bacteroidota bacterium]